MTKIKKLEKLEKRLLLLSDERVGLLLRLSALGPWRLENAFEPGLDSSLSSVSSGTSMGSTANSWHKLLDAKKCFADDEAEERVSGLIAQMLEENVPDGREVEIYQPIPVTGSLLGFGNTSLTLHELREGAAVFGLGYCPRDVMLMYLASINTKELDSLSLYDQKILVGMSPVNMGGHFQIFCIRKQNMLKDGHRYVLDVEEVRHKKKFDPDMVFLFGRKK